MKTVLFVKSSDFCAVRERIAGFMTIATAHGWNVQILSPVPDRRALARIGAFWKPDGYVLCCGAGNNNYPSALFNVPVVYLDRPTTALRPNDSCICQDSVASARLAARELLTLHLESYAYAGARHPTEWDRVRRETFAECLRPYGQRLTVIRTDLDVGNRHGHDAFDAALRTLRRPFGILAANDHFASLALAACRRAKIAVPDDAAVIGIDNDADICEYLKPALTSVEPDYQAAGRMAAEALAKLMARPSLRPLRLTYAPIRIVRRGTTRRLQRSDGQVAAALERIRTQACSGLTARDVLSDFGCSRRMAEIRFRKIVGHSVLAEIRAVRLERAKELLASSTDKLAVIAARCGYRSASAFVTFCKSATGRTPRRFIPAQ